MGQVWTRAKWNDIIRRINERIEQCQSGTPLEEVPEGHIWSVADIIAVRSRLEGMCRNEFDFSADLVKWTQTLIDELDDAIDNCDCGCTQALVDDMRSMHGYVVLRLALHRGTSSGSTTSGSMRVMDTGISNGRTSRTTTTEFQ